MLDNDFTLQNYMQEISPMVEEMEEEKGIIRRFEQSVAALRDESQRFHDNLTIHLTWQDNIARQLGKDYDETGLLELHGFAKGTIIQTDALYSIVVRGEKQVEFYFCNHMMYTPLSIASTLNQCLRCN